MELRQSLSASGMYSLVREQSLKIPDQRLMRPETISTAIPAENLVSKNTNDFKLLTRRLKYIENNFRG